MKKVLILFVVFIFVIVLILLVNSKKPPSPQGFFGGFNDIKPGSTTRTIIENNLGPPLTSEPIENGSISRYGSDNKYWTNDVYYEGGVVRLTRTKILPPQNSSFSKRVISLGEQPIPLYGQDSNIGILLYVYPGSGIAFLANKEQDIVYEEWKFAPTEITSFLNFPETKGFEVEKTGGKPEL